MPNAASDQGTNELGHALDLVADVEHLRLQRLAAGKRQELRGQLGRALDRLGDRLDITSAPLLGQFATTQEVGGGADDRQQVVEVMRHPAGQLADGFHFLRLAQHFLAPQAVGDVHCFGNGAGDVAVAVEHRPHREIEMPLADRKLQPHLDAYFFPAENGREGGADDVRHAISGGKPGCLPERLADDVGDVGADAGKRRPVGVEQLAFEIEQQLILVAGLEDRPHPGFVGFQLRGALDDALLQGLVQPAKLDLGLLGRGDVVGDADEPDVLAGGVPARLRLRAQPAPLAIGPPVAGLQHKRLERGLARDLLLKDPRQIIRMQRLAPVVGDGFLVGQADKIDIGLIGERARAVELGDPDRDRRAVGDQAKALLAFPQGLARQHLVGEVDMGADQPDRSTVMIALDLGNDANPSRAAVVGTDDAVFGGVVLILARDRVEKLPLRLLAIIGVKTPDPVVVGLVGRFGRQSVDDEIFRRAAVAKAVAKIDLDAADTADPLDPRQLRLAVLQLAMRAVSFARDFLEVLPQRRGRGFRRGHVGDLRAVMIVSDDLIRPWRVSPADPTQAKERGSATFLRVMRRRATWRVGGNTTDQERQFRSICSGSREQNPRCSVFASPKSKRSSVEQSLDQTLELSDQPWELSL